jgi:hypothetical protein
MAGQSTRMLVDTYEELSYLSAFVESLPIMDNRIDHLQSIICDIIQPIEDMLDSNGWDTEQLKKNGLDKTRTN